MNYPFTPKSTSYLEPGQFWAVPLSNGNYGCGVVLAKLISSGKIESRLFLGALIDWCGTEEPTPENIIGSSFLKTGAVHIKAIHTTGGNIIGKTEFSNLPQSPEEYTDSIVTMGYGVIEKMAENSCVKNS